MHKPQFWQEARSTLLDGANRRIHDMKSIWLNLVRTSLTAGLCLVAVLSATAKDEAPGIVCISKPSTAQTEARQVRQARFQQTSWNHGGSQFCEGECDYCDSGSSCPQCFGRHGCFGCNGCRSCCDSRDIVNYFRCKFGYFIPTGAGGAGVPFCGKYARVYPQDPHYFDQRDGQTWAAQGYGMPMAVPLAPVVGHTYNYGWGTPSSRLTPVSHPAY